MSTEDITDFYRSSFTWELPNQSSIGRFEIDSSLTLEAHNQTFFLGAQLFAGNVYGDGQLIIHPPYGFSVTFSDTTYRIFRDPVERESSQDTVGPVLEKFDQLHIGIVKTSARVMTESGV